MTGISQNAKNGNLPEFGEAIATASKALCGFTEAAAQVILSGSWNAPACPTPPPHSLTHVTFPKPTLWKRVLYPSWSIEICQ